MARQRKRPLRPKNMIADFNRSLELWRVALRGVPAIKRYTIDLNGRLRGTTPLVDITIWVDDKNGKEVSRTITMTAPHSPFLTDWNGNFPAVNPFVHPVPHDAQEACWKRAVQFARVRGWSAHFAHQAAIAAWGGNWHTTRYFPPKRKESP